MSLRYVQIRKFCADSGYTEKAVRRKIEEGVWIENRQYRRAPDGHLLIDTDAVAELEAHGEEPVRCGVYMLMLDGAVAYVGRSTNLQDRLSQHRQSGRQFDSVQVIACDEPTSVWLERELIRTLSPTQNLLRYKRHAAALSRSLEGVG